MRLKIVVKCQSIEDDVHVKIAIGCIYLHTNSNMLHIPMHSCVLLLNELIELLLWSIINGNVFYGCQNINIIAK